MTHPSQALGFYATHPAIMDELVNADDFDATFDAYARDRELPHELVALAKRHSALLEQLMDKAGTDLEDLEDACRDALVALIGTQRDEGKTRAPFWGCRIRCKPLDGARVGLEIGWSWETRQDRLYILPFLWRQGGRRAEQFLLREVSSWVGQNSTLQPASALNQWQAGALKLADVDVTGHVGEDFNLDIEACKRQLLDAFRWVTPERLDVLGSSLPER